MTQVPIGRLHYELMRSMVDRARVPSTAELASKLGSSIAEVEQGFVALADDHGVVLHPNSTNVWVLHPFSLAPTGFLLEQGDSSWWGTCAWCSLGAAELIGGDITIRTTLGMDGAPAVVEIRDDELVDDDFVVHFPVPMAKAWDSVTYTCGVMLLFRSETEVDEWCSRRGVTKGDVQPLSRVRQFAKEWYGDHLNPEWVKWTTSEAEAMFKRHGLVGPVWDLSTSEDRF